MANIAGDLLEWPCSTYFRGSSIISILFRCKGRVERPVGRAVALPDPFPVLHDLPLVRTEIQQQVAQHQRADGHEDRQEHHGPAERGQEALAGLHQQP